MRSKITILSLCASAMLFLSSCSVNVGDNSSNNNCDNNFSDKALSAIKIDKNGNVKADKLDFSTPVKVTKINTKIFGEGKGNHYSKPGDILIGQLGIYDGESGKSIQQSQNKGDSPIQIPVETDIKFFSALECLQVGNTVVTAVQRKDISPEVDNDLANKTSVIAYEVNKILPYTVSGKVNELPNYFPAITTDNMGRIGVILREDIPKNINKTALRIKGQGKKISKNDSVYMQTMSVDLESGELLESTYLGKNKDGNGGAVIDYADSPSAYRKYLINKRVGSQLVILSKESDKESARVIVIDILGTT